MCSQQKAAQRAGSPARFRQGHSTRNRPCLHHVIIPRSTAWQMRRDTMRFMILVKATKDSEAGKMPSRQLLADMGKFNQELMAAGVMIDGGGLRPSSTGARVTFSGNDRTVTKGPFAQTNELVSGYWIWKLNSLDEAIAWV